jgi:protein TonB
MKTLSWLISMSVHGLLLLLGGLSLQQVMVGVTPGRSSIEVNLVAAPSAPTPPAVTPPQPSPEEPVPPVQSVVPPDPEIQPPPVPVDPVLPPDPVPAVAVISPATPMPEPPKPAKPAPVSAKWHQARPTPGNTGKDTLTAQSLAGAIVDEEPDYLSNPAPLYPQAARDQEQEGLVILDVIVGTDGRAESIRISSSSGYHLLDDAALKAVHNYRFRTALLNGIKVRSHVQVPIRFRLDS